MEKRKGKINEIKKGVERKGKKEGEKGKGCCSGKEEETKLLSLFPGRKNIF